MKDKYKFINLLLNFIIVLFLFYKCNDNYIFIYCLYINLFLIFKNIFDIDYKELFYNYKNKKLVLNKVFFDTCLFSIIINIILFIFIFLILFLMNKIIYIKNLNLILYTSISLIGYSLLNIFVNYLSIYKLKINKYINYIITFLSFIIKINIILIFKNNILIKLLISSNLIVFIILFIMFIKINKVRINITSKKYYKEIVQLFNKNKDNIINNIIKNSFNYISIIILLYTLYHNYNFNILDIIKNINIMYLYSYMLINLFITAININVDNKEKYHDILIYLIDKLLYIVIIAFVLSKYTWYILFSSLEGYNIFMFMTLYIMFNYLFNYTMNSISIKSKKRALIIGLIIKILIIIPMINTCFRLGYNLLYGDIISNFIVYIILINYNLLIVKNKIEIDYILLFDNILKILYKNIIFLLFLSIINLIFRFNISKISYIFTIIIYLVIIILTSKIKKHIINYKNNLLKIKK